MKKIFLIIIVIICSIFTDRYFNLFEKIFGYNSYHECILAELNGNQVPLSASLIRTACRSIFPEADAANNQVSSEKTIIDLDLPIQPSEKTLKTAKKELLKIISIDHVYPDTIFTVKNNTNMEVVFLKFFIAHKIDNKCDRNNAFKIFQRHSVLNPNEVQQYRYSKLFERTGLMTYGACFWVKGYNY